MAFQILLNFFIAFVWMFMSTSCHRYDIHHRLFNWSDFNHYDETIFQGKTLYLAAYGRLLN